MIAFKFDAYGFEIQLIVDLLSALVSKGSLMCCFLK